MNELKEEVCDGVCLLMVCASPEKHCFTDKNGKTYEWYVAKMTKKGSSVIFPIPCKINSGIDKVKPGTFVKFAFNVRLKNVLAFSDKGNYNKPYSDFVLVSILDTSLDKSFK